MKVLIVGLGSIGRRHLKNIKAIDPRIKVAVLRQHSKKGRLGELKAPVEKVFFKKRDALHWQPDIVFVTNPAPFHIKTALTFAKRQAHLFIEKPLSVETKNVAELLRVCKKHHLVLMVGYVLRFFEPLKLMKKTLEEGTIGRVLSVRASVGRYLPDWRPYGDYRLNVSARRELGGGAVFELSHELDYVRWFAGEIKEVSACLDTIGDFAIDVEDIAEINLRFKNNAMGNVHLNMLDRSANRSCRIVGTNGTLQWDSSDDKHFVRLYSSKTNSWVDVLPLKSLDHNQMYLDELRHFFDCVHHKIQPLVNGVEALRIVEIALAAKKSAQKKETVKI